MSASVSRDLESPEELSRRLGLEFSDLYLLVRALTHSSYVNEHSQSAEDNERLEFLGDAVLDFIVGAWVFNRYPEMPEGDLTKIRSALVRNDHLAKFARKLDLGRALRLGRGESASGGKGRDSLLGSTFEAFIGAIYMDKGLGLDAVEKFFTPMLDELRDSIVSETYDYKSMLQEHTQAEKQGSPHYQVVNKTGPEHAAIFEVEVSIQGVVKGRGTGSSKSLAQHAAAHDALVKMGLVDR
jgi:ribonuclease-3